MRPLASGQSKAEIEESRLSTTAYADASLGNDCQEKVDHQQQVDIGYVCETFVWFGTVHQRIK